MGRSAGARGATRALRLLALAGLCVAPGDGFLGPSPSLLARDAAGLPRGAPGQLAWTQHRRCGRVAARRTLRGAEMVAGSADVEEKEAVTVTESVEQSIEIDAAPELCYRVAARLEDYPDWVGSLDSVEVEDAGRDGLAKRAKFAVGAFGQTLDYTLEYTHEVPRRLSWKAVAGSVRALVGSYTFEAIDGGKRTRVRYKLALDPGFSIPSMIKKASTKLIVKTALSDLRQYTETPLAQQRAKELMDTQGALRPAQSAEASAQKPSAHATYDAASIRGYYRARPWELLQRLAALTRILAAPVAALLLSALQGQRGRALIDANGKALADALAQAGPTYSKFGQALSCRPDLVGDTLASALQELQDQIPPFSHAEARSIMREELGADADELLASMGAQPVAAATLGQVYKARAGGKDVAVKVQRPNIMTAVAADSVLLRAGAAALEMVRNPVNGERVIKPELVAACDEFFSRLFEEADYSREAANLAKFAAIYGGVEGRDGSSRIIVPNLLPELSTERVITMEWVQGQRLSANAIVDVGDLPTLRLDP